MERYLIINADDYGSVWAVNEAVEHLFNEGRITSTTLMTPCPWSMDAINRAKNNKKMRVGLHTTFNSTWVGYKYGPVSRRKLVNSLINENGHFYSDVKTHLKFAKSEDIVTELEAQYDYMANQGLKPTHADNHMGNLYGIEGQSFLKETFEFCARHKLNFRMISSAEGYGQVPEHLKEAVAELASMAEEMGIGILDNLLTHPYGLKENDTYESFKEFYLNLIRNTKPGITEIFLHPSKETEELKAGNKTGWQKKVWEYRLLLDDDVMKTIESEGIKLVGWTDAPFKR